MKWRFLLRTRRPSKPWEKLNRQGSGGRGWLCPEGEPQQTDERVSWGSGPRGHGSRLEGVQLVSAFLQISRALLPHGPQFLVGWAARLC